MQSSTQEDDDVIVVLARPRIDLELSIKGEDDGFDSIVDAASCKNVEELFALASENLSAPLAGRKAAEICVKYFRDGKEKNLRIGRQHGERAFDILYRACRAESQRDGSRTYAVKGIVVPEVLTERSELLKPAEHRLFEASMSLPTSSTADQLDLGFGQGRAGSASGGRGGDCHGDGSFTQGQWQPTPPRSARSSLRESSSEIKSESPYERPFSVPAPLSQDTQRNSADDRLIDVQAQRDSSAHVEDSCIVCQTAHNGELQQDLHIDMHQLRLPIDTAGELGGQFPHDNAGSAETADPPASTQIASDIGPASRSTASHTAPAAGPFPTRVSQGPRASRRHRGPIGGAERRRRHLNGLCSYCGKAGHIATEKDCPEIRARDTHWTKHNSSAAAAAVNHHSAGNDTMRAVEPSGPAHWTEPPARIQEPPASPPARRNLPASRRDVYEVPQTPPPPPASPPAAQGQAGPQCQAGRASYGSHAKTVYRKPESMSQGDWDRYNGKNQLRYSHIGRIEETDAGIQAPEPCEWCGTDNSCMVYDETARAQYHSDNTGFGCSRCRKGSHICSFSTNSWRQVRSCSSRSGAHPEVGERQSRTVLHVR